MRVSQYDITPNWVTRKTMGPVKYNQKRSPASMLAASAWDWSVIRRASQGLITSITAMVATLTATLIQVHNRSNCRASLSRRGSTIANSYRPAAIGTTAETADITST
ncbi:Uncharacterised protein [Mycobacteroides abscessus subsp. abscessus]|nr:Uncharacterised protein [Mycobacteroides abscessus subsp. abscessus]